MVNSIKDKCQYIFKFHQGIKNYNSPNSPDYIISYRIRVESRRRGGFEWRAYRSRPPPRPRQRAVSYRHYLLPIQPSPLTLPANDARLHFRRCKHDDLCNKLRHRINCPRPKLDFPCVTVLIVNRNDEGN